MKTNKVYLKILLILSLVLSSSVFLYKVRASASQTPAKPEAIKPALLSDAVSIHAAGRGNPAISLSDGHDVVAENVGAQAARAALDANTATPLGLASADFDEDGVPDLISAYAAPSGGLFTLHRGNIDAVYPNGPQARARKQRGEFSDAPFLSPAASFDLPQSPDFIGTGDFNADGHQDIVVASRSSNSLLFLLGDGHGDFGTTKQIILPGTVTALAAGEVNRVDRLADLTIGVTGASGSRVLVFQGGSGAIKASPVSYDLAAPAKAFVTGRLDDSYLMDIAIAAGNDVIVIRGRDQVAVGAATIQPQISRRHFKSEVRSLALGSFVNRGQTNLAVLTTDGVVHLLSQDANAKQGEKGFSIAQWKDQSPASPALTGAIQLVRARVSSGQTDSLVAIDSAGRQLHVIANDPYLNRSGQVMAQSRPSDLAALDVESEPVAVLPLRLNRTALDSLVTLRRGHSGPGVLTPQAMMIFTVTSTLDDDTPGTLKAAIDLANSNPGLDEIDFAIGTGPQTIPLGGVLPTISDPVTIDGTTQPGFNGRPIIEIDGSALDGDGIAVDSLGSGSTIEGLVINHFGTSSGNGINLLGDNNVIQRNFIGTNLSGTAAVANAMTGVSVSGLNNTIGGSTDGQGNLISGNSGNGVALTSNGNSVQDNLIGTDVTGTLPLGNHLDGIAITNASNNLIGTGFADTANIISGSVNVSQNGIHITGGSANGISGNLIGTDITGKIPIPNSGNGILIENSPNNGIGGAAGGSHNTVSGGNFNGIVVMGSSSTNTAILGNMVGTDSTGTGPLGNLFVGILIDGASNNIIGTTDEGAGNVLSGNGRALAGFEGLRIIDGANGNTVQSNFIGTDTTGAFAIPNSGAGIVIGDFGAGGGTGNVIGGTAGAARNIIAGNGFHGVTLTGPGVTGNHVIGNRIGITGTGLPLGNSLNGISIVNGANNNTIGGLNSGEPNIIAFNGTNGVRVIGSTGDAILSNSIFSNTRLGIDLNDDGVTPNDPGDADTGGNNLQNFPQLTAVSAAPSGTLVTGTLNSAPNTNYTLQFFTNQSCSPSGFGEGQNFLANHTVNTDSDGNVNFSVIIPGTFNPPITVTATDPAGNTSEFSSCALAASSADLSIRLAASESSPKPGDTLTYTLTVSNLGPLTASGVVINDTLPGTLTFVSCSTSAGGQCQGTGNARVISFGAILPGTSATVTLITKVNDGLATGTVIHNVATVTSAIEDDVQANNTATLDLVINADAPGLTCPANISVTTTANQCSATVQYPLPTVRGIPSATVRCSPPPGSTFPAGTTAVNCVAQGVEGVAATCGFSITVNTPPAVTVTLENGGTALDFGPAEAQVKNKKKTPKGCDCTHTFTIENTGCATVNLLFFPPVRTGPDVANGKITSRDDSSIFPVTVINADGTEQPVVCSGGCSVNLAVGERRTFRVRFTPLLPNYAGKTSGLNAINVIPNTITSQINFSINGSIVPTNIDLIGQVTTEVHILNPDNARGPKQATMTKSGDEFTVEYGVYDSDLDVSQATYEFLDASGNVIGQSIDVDLASVISQEGVVKGQSFVVTQKFTGAKSNKKVAGVRVTIKDSHSTDTETARLGASASSAVSAQQTDRVTLVPPMQRLAPRP